MLVETLPNAIITNQFGWRVTWLNKCERMLVSIAVQYNHAQLGMDYGVVVLHLVVFQVTRARRNWYTSLVARKARTTYESSCNFNVCGLYHWSILKCRGIFRQLPAVWILNHIAIIYLIRSSKCNFICAVKLEGSCITRIRYHQWRTHKNPNTQSRLLLLAEARIFIRSYEYECRSSYK